MGVGFDSPSAMSPTMEALSLWEVTAQGTHLHPLLPGWHTSLQLRPMANGLRTENTSSFKSQGQIWALPRSGWTLWPDRWQAHTVDQSARLTLASPLPGKDGKQLFVVGRAQHGMLSRYDRNIGEFVPFLSGLSVEPTDLLQRWTMDRLRYLSRRHVLAEQTRRKRTAASHRPADQCNQSALVAGRETDCVLAEQNGRTRQDLHDIDQWRHSRATAAGRWLFLAMSRTGRRTEIGSCSRRLCLTARGRLKLLDLRTHRVVPGARVRRLHRTSLVSRRTISSSPLTRDALKLVLFDF